MTLTPSTLDISAEELLADGLFITATAPRIVAPRFTLNVKLDRSRDLVVAATLAATAHGIYEARIDGKLVTDSVLEPGWNAYEWRLQVQRYDVTNLIRDGQGCLALELLLGNGWYRGDLGFLGANANYGEDISVCSVLHIIFADGTTQRIGTSEEWHATASDIISNSLYNGQTIDARQRHGHNGERFAVRAVEVDRHRLVVDKGPSVTRHEVLRPVKVWTSSSGRTFVDFGQNLVGWIRFTTTGPAGTKITIRHAEVLENDELGTRPLRDAKATDVYYLSGGHDAFEPTFTFHGFRFAEVEGWPGELEADDLEAVVIHSQMQRTGHFECSDPLVNRLVRNAIWGQKGNFLSVPTDCPQRDERLGWTGDIAAYAASACFAFDSADFLDDWLRDLYVETVNEPRKIVPIVVPDALKYASFTTDSIFPGIGPTAIWGDAAIWVPQALWNAYGDLERLRSHYPSMVLHLESVERALSPSGLWLEGFQFADWLDPDAPPDDPVAAKADPGVVATACLFRSASFAAVAAKQLGYLSDAERWAGLAGRTRSAFGRSYVEPNGLIRSDCTTVYSLAICFGLLDEDARSAAGTRLAELVRASGFRVTTGFAGTPFITWALSDTGHVEEAYALLLATDCPSWLYPVTMGATTIWERWDAMLPDGTINPGEMTSFNHYALGAVVDWIYQVVGGIRPDMPGYRRVRIEPVPGSGIDWARTSYESVAGPIETFWRRSEDEFVLDLHLPAELPATIVMPNGSKFDVTGGEHTFSVPL